MMRNIKAPGYRILVRLLDIDKNKEEVSEGGLILSIKTEKDLELEQQGTVEGYVIDIGQVAFRNLGDPWCKVGDKVQFYKHAGTLVDGKDGHTYRVIQDLDIQAVFLDEGVNDNV